MRQTSRWMSGITAGWVVMSLVLCAGCHHDDSDGIVGAPIASFAESGTSAGPDLVRLRSASASGDALVVEVVLGGPTSSGNLYGFVFDLVLGDPSVARLVANSGQAGGALTGSQVIVEAGTQAGDEGRVVVAVTKVGNAQGNGFSGSEAVVVRLGFQVLKRGTTMIVFGGHVSARNPEGRPVAVDPAGDIVATIEFDAAAARISGN